LRQYVGQMRQELAARLGERLYAEGDAAPSKVSCTGGVSCEI